MFIGIKYSNGDYEVPIEVDGETWSDLVSVAIREVKVTAVESGTQYGDRISLCLYEEEWEIVLEYPCGTQCYYKAFDTIEDCQAWMETEVR